MNRFVVFAIAATLAVSACANPADWYGEGYDYAQQFCNFTLKARDVVVDYSELILEMTDGQFEVPRVTVKQAWFLAFLAAQNAMDAKLAAKSIADKLDTEAVVSIELSNDASAGGVTLTYKTTNLGSSTGERKSYPVGTILDYTVNKDGTMYWLQAGGEKIGYDWNTSPPVDNKSMAYFKTNDIDRLQINGWNDPSGWGHWNDLAEVLTDKTLTGEGGYYKDARVPFRASNGSIGYFRIGHIDTNSTSSASVPPDGKSIETWLNNGTNYLALSGFHAAADRNAARLPVASGTGADAVLSWWDVAAGYSTTVNALLDTREFGIVGDKATLYGIKGYNNTGWQSIPYKSYADSSDTIAWSGTPPKAGAILTKVGDESKVLEWSLPSSGGMYYGTAQGGDASGGAGWFILPVIPHDFAPTNGTYYTDGKSINTNSQGYSQIYNWDAIGSSVTGILYKDGEHPVVLSNAAKVAVAATNGLEMVRLPDTTDAALEKAVGLLGWQNGTATNCGITVNELLTDSTVAERSHHYVMMKYFDSTSGATTIHYAALGDVIKTNAVTATGGFTGSFSAFPAANGTIITNGCVTIGRKPYRVAGKEINAAQTCYVSVKVTLPYTKDNKPELVTTIDPFSDSNPSGNISYIPVYHFTAGKIDEDYRGSFNVPAYDE